MADGKFQIIGREFASLSVDLSQEELFKLLGGDGVKTEVWLEQGETERKENKKAYISVSINKK